MSKLNNFLENIFFMECFALEENRLLILQKLLKEKGIDYFSYGMQNADSSMQAFFSNSFWEKEYVSHNLFEVDPLVDGAKKLKTKIIPWDMVPIINEKQHAVMMNRYRVCEVSSGITFVKNTENKLEILAIGFAKEIPENYYEIISALFDIIQEESQ